MMYLVSGLLLYPVSYLLQYLISCILPALVSCILPAPVSCVLYSTCSCILYLVSYLLLYPVSYLLPYPVSCIVSYLLLNPMNHVILETVQYFLLLFSIHREPRGRGIILRPEIKLIVYKFTLNTYVYVLLYWPLKPNFFFKSSRFFTFRRLHENMRCLSCFIIVFSFVISLLSKQLANFSHVKRY